SDNHFAENFDDGFGQRLTKQSVANDDPAKWCLFVRRECFFPRLAKIGIGTYTARIGMFENRDGRLLEFADQIRRSADVENVVKGKLLAVKFFEMCIEIAVKRRALMRIFPITQPHHQRKGK